MPEYISLSPPGVASLLSQLDLGIWTFTMVDFPFPGVPHSDPSIFTSRGGISMPIGFIPLWMSGAYFSLSPPCVQAFSYFLDLGMWTSTVVSPIWVVPSYDHYYYFVRRFLRGFYTSFGPIWCGELMFQIAGSGLL